MAYTKLNLQNGHVLTADDMAHLEQGIADAQNTGGTTEPTAVTAEAPLVAETTGSTVNLSITAASTDSPGSMSAADKKKLDGLENYTLPAASNTTLGGVMVDGQTITVNDSGVISAKQQNSGGTPVQPTVVTATSPLHAQTTDNTVNLTVDSASASQPGVMSAADKTKLDGLENYSLPVASDTVLGGVKVDARTITIDGNGVIHGQANGAQLSDITTVEPLRISGNSEGVSLSIDAASPESSGAMSAEDKKKLDSLSPSVPQVGQTVGLLAGVQPETIWPDTTWVRTGVTGEQVIWARTDGELPDPPDSLPHQLDLPYYTGFPPVTVVDQNAGDYFSSIRWWAKTTPTGPTASKGVHHIQAHGGGITREGDTWYWVGESHEKGYSDSPGIHLYTSKDLRNWTDQGIVMRMINDPTAAADPKTETYRYFHDLYGTEYDKVYKYLLTHSDGKTPTAIAERPKMLHNPRTGKWVIWFHADGQTSVGGSNYSRALLGCAISDEPTGPFKLIGAYKGFNDDNTIYGGWGEVGDARDMTLYKASNGDAYVAYSSEGNKSTYVAKLDDDWTHLCVTTDTDESKSKIQYSADGKYTKILPGGRGTNWQIIADDSREAIAFLEYGGHVYAITSPTNGWKPGKQNYYVSGGSNIFNAYGSGIDLCRGIDSIEGKADHNITFGSQCSYIVPWNPDLGEFIYFGDRWDSGSGQSTYVVLPIVIYDDNGTTKLRMANPQTSWRPEDYWRITGSEHWPNK